jgi:hypothetical protein
MKNTAPPPASHNESVIASVILSDMDRTEHALYAYRSWLLQDLSLPYEVVLILLNHNSKQFAALEHDRNPYCATKIRAFDRPQFFNISAANNLGIHYATGKYIVFANSDMIFPSGYLRELADELDSRQLFYVTGSRINLDRGQTAALKEPAAYTTARNFDFLANLVSEDRQRSPVPSPWVFSRSTITAIGGFDPQVLCLEDSECRDRAIHYLRRTKQQLFEYRIADIFGYHLDHPPSELYIAADQAHRVIASRKQLLSAYPSGTEDTLATVLTDVTSLISELTRTTDPVGIASTFRGRLRCRVFGIRPTWLRNAALCVGRALSNRVRAWRTL